MSKKTLFTLNLLTSAKVIIVLRVVILSVFLGSVILFQGSIDDRYPLLPISIIIFTYILTIIYSVSLKYIKRLRLFCYVQIIGDLLIETIVIFITGGIDSVFTFLYILSIISASIILIKPGNYITASLSGILYSIVAYCEFYNIIDFADLYSPAEIGGLYIIYKVFLNISAFFIVAYLSGYLGEKWRATGIELEVKSENLIELQRFNDNIVKSMNSGLITTGLDGSITSFNDAARNITGFSIDEVLGMPIKEFFSSIDIERLLDSYTKKVTKDISRHEGNFVRRDGRTIFIGLSISSLKDDDAHNNGFIIMFQNLTEMKEMEKKVAEAEKLAAIGQVAAGIAHEIRNPLASMSGSIQVLQDELTLSGNNKRLMDIVLKEADRLNLIITQFLDYARPQPVTIGMFNVNSIIRETVTLLKNSPKYSEKIRIELDMPDELIAPVDMAQIKQVIINLLLNSFDAMNDGGAITISADSVSNGSKPVGNGVGKYVHMAIEDQGSGMSESTLNNIFNPFFTTKQKGTGLGLALVYRIIEKHRGLIEVKSEKQKGTRFDIYIPSEIG